MELLVPLLLVVVTSIWIMLACNPFEDAADYLGRNLGSGIKGATINAIGSSLPELFVTFLSLFVFKERAGFATGIATSAGSAVFNAAVIPSVVIFAVLFGLKHKGIALDKKVIIRDGAFYILSVVAFILLIQQPQFTWWMGALLMGIYAAYCGFLILSHAGSGEEEEEEEEEEEHSHNKLVAFIKFDYLMLFTGGKGFNTGTAWAALLLATINIGAACYFLTESVIHLGEIWEIPVFFVAVILAAAATSVPDTILSVKDAMKGNFEDAMSNAIGSNIFDICIGLGLPVTLYTLINSTSLAVPTETISGVLELIVILLVMTFGIIALFLIPKKVGIKTAITLASGYIFYIVYVISTAKELAWAQGISSAITGLFGK